MIVVEFSNGLFGGASENTFRKQEEVRLLTAQQVWA